MCSIQFSDLSIVPLDFWHRHFLVYDAHYRKLGSCDFVGGVWYFHESKNCTNQEYDSRNNQDYQKRRKYLFVNYHNAQSSPAPFEYLFFNFNFQKLVR